MSLELSAVPNSFKSLVNGFVSLEVLDVELVELVLEADDVLSVDDVLDVLLVPRMLVSEL